MASTTGNRRRPIKRNSGRRHRTHRSSICVRHTRYSVD